MSKILLALVSAVSPILGGCSTANKAPLLGGHADSTYETEADDRPEVSAFDVDGDDRPLATCDSPHTIRDELENEIPKEYRPIGLREAIDYALHHSRVMRDLGGSVLLAPERMQTKYTAALVNADPRIGVEAALSDFDPRFTASGDFENNHRLLNNVFYGGGTRNFSQNLNVFQAQVSKQAATGTQYFLRNFTDYNNNNAPGNQFPGAWNSNIEAQVRQPLLQGAGTDFNRIAGPTSGVGNLRGVLIARVNTKIGQADFELGLRDFISNIVNSYWDLYFAYRDLDAKVRARDNALEMWQKLEANEAGSTQAMAAQEQYLRFEEDVQNSLTGKQFFGTRTNNGTQGGTFQLPSGVHVAERRLRLLIGMPITERGVLLRPADEPKIARFEYDWDTIVCEAIDRRPELKRQRLRIRRREMELLATRNFLKPRLDATGLYRLRGFGETLAGGPVGDQGVSAWGNLLGADYQEWQLGFEFSIAIGQRQAHVAVHAAELALASDRALLEEQERQVVHDLTNAVAELDRAYTLCQTTLTRFRTSKNLVVSLEAKEDWNPNFERLIDGQRRAVDAERSFYQSQIEYEVALKNVSYEKNSLMEDYGFEVLDFDKGHATTSFRSRQVSPALKSSPTTGAPATAVPKPEPAPAVEEPAPGQP
ncbi:MAG: TolC family protein [Planctomycetes bacterium]|nr:TolC family protein [Planctomycetota bacterium]